MAISFFYDIIKEFSFSYNEDDQPWVCCLYIEESLQKEAHIVNTKLVSLKRLE